MDVGRSAGSSGGMLPEACRTPNEYGVKGGIEGGFMSTTTDGETALFYAKGGADKSKRGGPALLPPPDDVRLCFRRRQQR